MEHDKLRTAIALQIRVRQRSSGCAVRLSVLKTRGAGLTGIFFEVAEAALAELDAAMEGERG